MSASEAPTNIYLVPLDGSSYRQLTDDSRPKHMATNHPFSYRNEWLLFGTSNGPSNPPILHAIRTDGSGEEITGWLPPAIFILSANWTPPIPTLPYHATFLFIGGLGFVLLSFAIHRKLQKTANLQ